MCAGFTFVSHILIITPQAEQITHPKQHFLRNLRYYPHKKHAKKTTTYQSKLTFFNLGSPGSPFNDVNPTFISDKFSKLLNSSVSPTIVVDRQLSRLSSFTFKI